MERAYRMFSAEQHRTKAAEFRALLMNIPRSPNETRELRSLEQTYTTLAENEEWMAVNLDKTIQRRRDHANRGGSTDYLPIQFDGSLGPGSGGSLNKANKAQIAKDCR
jgi:hypothetical protein